MAVLLPSAVVAQGNLVGSLADLTDDPFAPDGQWFISYGHAVGVTVSWTAPDPATDIDRYRVAWYSGGYFVNSTSVDHPTTTVTLSDLPPGTYEFFVTSIKTDNQESDPVSVGTKVVS